MSPWCFTAVVLVVLGDLAAEVTVMAWRKRVEDLFVNSAVWVVRGVAPSDNGPSQQGIPDPPEDYSVLACSVLPGVKCGGY